MFKMNYKNIAVELVENILLEAIKIINQELHIRY